MKALTIQQPYASLIALPDGDDRAKRVENRTWSTDYRGLLAIHAGRGREYLEADDTRHGFDLYGFEIAKLPYGAIVAVANLTGCVQLDRTTVKLSGLVVNGRTYQPIEREQVSVPEWAGRRWPWLAAHQHTEGPICWVLTEVRALPAPIACRGAQGLWNVPAELAKQLEEMKCTQDAQSQLNSKDRR